MGISLENHSSPTENSKKKPSSSTENLKNKQKIERKFFLNFFQKFSEIFPKYFRKIFLKSHSAENIDESFRVAQRFIFGKN